MYSTSMWQAKAKWTTFLLALGGRIWRIEKGLLSFVFKPPRLLGELNLISEVSEGIYLREKGEGEREKPREKKRLSN